MEELIESIEAVFDWIGTSGSNIPEHIVNHINTIISAVKTPERKSSITIGTPAKGGEVKIYFDFSKPDDCSMQITQAFISMEDMKRQYAKQQQ